MYVEENNLYAIFNLEKLLDDDSIFMHLAVMLLVFKFVFIWSYSWRGIKSVRKVFAGGGSEIFILVGGGGYIVGVTGSRNFEVKTKIA